MATNAVEYVGFNMSQRTFIDTQLATRRNLQPRTWLHHTTSQASYTARINDNGDWTAYRGDPDWGPTKVAVSGYRLSEQRAREIFPVCAHLTYRTTLKLIPFKPKRKASVRAVLDSFEDALERAGLAEIEDLKVQRLRAGMALAEAIELAQDIKSSSITDLPKNLNQLTKRLEDVMHSLRPLGEENAPANYSTEETAS